MRSLFLVIFMFVVANAEAGTCTSISRTNNSSNQVLTSTKYNLDHNTAYTAINAADGGCITDGTLEDGALNTTDFDVILKAPKEGCLVSRSDANTLSVGKCRIAVNGNWVTTTTATTVTWGCTSCSSEVASTRYYLYALSTSTGSTLNLLISTTAPNADGYDNSNNRILAEFVNDSSSAIQDDILNWHTNKQVGDTIEGIAVALDMKADGTSGGSCVYGCGNTRVINTLSGDTSFVSLSANQLTLMPGKYIITASGQSRGVGGTAQILYDVTNATTKTIGLSTYDDDNNNGTSSFTAHVEPTASTVYEIRMCAQATLATTCMGRDNVITNGNEVYLKATIMKLK